MADSYLKEVAKEKKKRDDVDDPFLTIEVKTDSLAKDVYKAVKNKKYTTTMTFTLYDEDGALPAKLKDWKVGTFTLESK